MHASLAYKFKGANAYKLEGSLVDEQRLTQINQERRYKGIPLFLV